MVRPVSMEKNPKCINFKDKKILSHFNYMFKPEKVIKIANVSSILVFLILPWLTVREYYEIF